MSTLDGLFANDRGTARSTTDSAPDTDPDALGRLVGPRRKVAAPTRVSADTAQLVAMVDAAQRTAVAPPNTGVDAKSKGRRRIRRIDWISVSAAAVAVVAVVGTLGFAGVQAASASPATLASQSLAEDRSALASAEQGLNAALERLTTTVATARTEASTARTAILGLDETLIDQAARSTVVTAADSYLTSLDGVILPEIPEPYVPADTDDAPLAEIAAELDAVRERSTEVDDAVTEIRVVREGVDQSGTTFAQALSAFGTTFSARAAVEVEENPNAEQSFRDTVVSAAAFLATAPLNEASGQQGLIAYQDAVLALRDDEQRAREEAEREASSNKGTGGQNGGQQGGEGDGTTTPPTTETPVDPAVPPGESTDPSTEP